jgi:uncharacterized protein DUF3592
LTVQNPTAPLSNHMRRYDIATVGLLLLAATVYFSYAHLRDFAWQLKAHMRFESVDAVIVESTVHSTGSHGAATELYQPHVVYRYSLDGVDYNGERLYFGSGGWRDRHAAEAMIRGYPEGAHVTAYIDDEDRHMAVLDRRRPESGVLIYMLPLTAASVAAMVFGLRKHIKH